MAKFMKSQSMARKKTGGGQDKPKKSRGPKRTKYENQGDKEAKKFISKTDRLIHLILSSILLIMSKIKRRTGEKRK